MTEDSVSLAIVRFQYRASTVEYVTLPRQWSMSHYLDSGVCHIGGGAGHGGLGRADGEQVVDAGRSPGPHRVGGPADEGAKIHFVLRRVLNYAFCSGNCDIRILSW